MTQSFKRQDGKKYQVKTYFKNYFDNTNIEKIRT